MSSHPFLQTPNPPSTSSPTSTPTSTPTSPPPTTTTHTQEAQGAQAAFTATLRAIGANHETALRERARNLHDNASVLAAQEAELARSTAELARLNQGWEKVADGARDGLKEIGDVQNWAELIERDLLVVEEMLAEVEGGKQTQFGRGEGDGDGDREGRGEDGGKGDGKGQGQEQGQGQDGEAKGWLRWW